MARQTEFCWLNKHPGPSFFVSKIPKRLRLFQKAYSPIRSFGLNIDYQLQNDAHNNALIMSFGGILSTVTSSLVRLNYASAPNSTNFGAHEVAKAKVSLQEEGGVHIFQKVLAT